METPKTPLVKTLMSKSFQCSAVYPTLAVPNVLDTCNWYVDHLGFTIRFVWGEPPTHGAVLLDKACVHFWQGEPQLGANWLYFDVNDLDVVYARATTSRVNITRAPETYPWGMREFNAVDLNGYNIRFGQHMGSDG
ncbi:Glyoxalase-like domain protein [Labrenzia sp. THAF82]|nr:Glyoxalase-like domain protein [Labrenzia sp. THAF82]